MATLPPEKRTYQIVYYVFDVVHADGDD